MNEYKPEGMLLKTAKNYEYISSKTGLEKAMDGQKIIEAPVILCDHNMNLHVELGGGMRGIIPKEEVIYSTDGEDIKDIAILTRVGKPVCFKVCGFKYLSCGECIAVLSRRSAQKECLERYIDTLAPGDIIPTRVTHLESFGAFLDIGCGIISLLSIDCISVSRISHPKNRMSPGDTLQTVVKCRDDKGRIFLSLRELLGTWEENASNFSEGQTVRGIIRSIESYGIFVELAPNLAGLAEYKENLHTGQTAASYIKSIIPDKMKIKLIIIDVDEGPLTPTPINYYIDIENTTHIDRWCYSPKISKRIIESRFDQDELATLRP